MVWTANRRHWFSHESTGGTKGVISPSRIYLGDHWASDVLGAYLIGGVLLGFTVGLFLLLKGRYVLETPEAYARMKKQKA
jgi:hypothetical protein